MSYAQFVKLNYENVKHLPHKARFSALSEMWNGNNKSTTKLKTKNNKKISGGDLNINTSNYWVYPIPEGYPTFLFKHPNQYSANPNQVLVFTNEARFLKSSLYNKYKSTIQIKEQKYSGYRADIKSDNAGSSVIPGLKFRVLFVDKSVNNTTKYILDCNNLDTYLDVVDMAKDSNFIIPVEILATTNIEKWSEQRNKEIELSNQYFKAGYDKSEAEYEAKKKLDEEEAERQKQNEKKNDNDGGIFGTIASGFKTALSLFI